MVDHTSEYWPTRDTGMHDSRIHEPRSRAVRTYGRPSKDWWDKFRTITQFSIAVVGLVWAVVSWLLVQYHEERASQRQAQAAIEASNLQRKISTAQLGAGLVPSLARGSGPERQTALIILTSVDPNLAKTVSDVLQASAVTPAERELARNTAEEIRDLSTQTKTTQEFRRHLENARVYQRFQLYGQADGEYMGSAQESGTAPD